MENPGKAGEAAAANIFLQQYRFDQAESRERTLEEYQDLFPGFEDVISRQWALIHGEVSSDDLAEVEIPHELLPEEPGGWQELLDRIRHRNLDETRFEDRGELARGGMGVVDFLFDSDLRRTVAMKICLAMDAPPDSAGGEAQSMGRFLEEAQVTAQLEHPGVVPVHDLGVDASGKPFFTMRLVRGKDLRQVFKQVKEGEEGWTQTRALGVLMKACEALAYAHDKGVIHRDLKPPNIMVGKFGEVYVMDWGLARVRGREETRDLRLQRESPPTQSMKTLRRDQRQETPDSPLVTMDGDVMGTPAYMSPEQARGDVENIGPRSDVYAMGAILYELLSNRFPYELPGTRRTPRTILSLLQEGPPPPLSDVASEVPVQLMAICEKAMSRDAADRYADMIEFADDLRAYLEGRVVQAYETGALAEMKSWVRRNRALSTTIAASILVVVLGSVGYVWKIEKEKTRAEAVKEFVVKMLMSVDPGRAGTMDKELMKMVLSDAAVNVGEEFADHPLLEAEIRAVIGRTYSGLGLYPEASPHLEKALELYRRELGDEHPSTLVAINRLGVQLIFQSKLAEAEALLREALDGQLRELGDEHHETLISINDLGMLLKFQSKFAEAEPFIREALEGRRRTLGDEDPHTLQSIHNLGMLLRAQGKYAEAESFVREAVEGRRRTFGDEHPQALGSLKDLGLLLQDMGKYAEAEPLFRDAVEGSRRTLGDEHPSTLSSINCLGLLFRAQGKHAESEALFREALEGRRRTLGDEHPSTLGSLNDLGILLRTQGKYAEAEPLLREALEGIRSTLGDEHQSALSSLNSLATLLQAQGKYAEAEVLYRETLELRRRTLGEEHPKTLASINNLGIVFIAQGKHAEAEPLFRDAVEGSRRILGDEHPSTLFFITSLGVHFAGQGKYAEAEPLFREALEGRRHTLGDGSSSTHKSARAMMLLYTAWHEAEPDASHDARANEYRALLEKIQGPSPDPESDSEGQDDE